jgi:hypothetical protein
VLIICALIPDGYLTQSLFESSELESFLVRFNNGFVNSFKASSFAKPNKFIESDFRSVVDEVKNSTNSLEGN